MALKLSDNDLLKIFPKRFFEAMCFIDPKFTMSDKEFAGEMGLSPQNFSDYKNGLKLPSMLNYLKIVKYFSSKISNFNEDYLIGISDVISKENKEIVKKLNANEELAKRLYELFDNQNALYNLLCSSHAENLLKNFDSINNVVERNIQELINEWKLGKKEFNQTSLEFVGAIIKYRNNFNEQVNYANTEFMQCLHNAIFDSIVKTLHSINNKDKLPNNVVGVIKDKDTESLYNFLVENEIKLKRLLEYQIDSTYKLF